MTDEFVTERLYGNYRAKVVDNKDKEQFGRIKVWIPDLMPQIDDRQGLWARPANNPIGGRNVPANITTRRQPERGRLSFPDDEPEEGDETKNYYAGSSYIPPISSWVWIFFEAGNINRPYYFGALDIENAKVLPENQVGDEYEKKWTILKTHKGRAIVISDDPFDERVEITGKKRWIDATTIRKPPSGDQDSVFRIDNNMTTILLDERDEKQKLLIRTYKGDFVHIDIDERKLQAEFESDIVIKTNGKFYLTAKEDIHILSEEGDINIMTETEDININAKKNLNLFANDEDVNIRAERQHMKLAALEDTHITSVVGDIHIDATSGDTHVISGNDMYNTSGGDLNVIAQNDHIVQSGSQMSRRAGTSHDTDAGTNVNVQSGTSVAASPGTNAEIAGIAEEALPAEPKGERNT